jgi:hypothetical protein
MSIPITIQNTVIQFPAVAASPQWGEAVIQFAQATAGALASVTGGYDVAPIVIDISASNPASNVAITPLNFPPAAVRSAFISYAVYRTATSPTTVVNETGTITILYNTASGTWQLAQDWIGSANISFSISNSGLVSYTTTQIGSAGHVGQLSIAAKAVLNSN